jgi:D-psicose/D-tagatose/L-ribulose 3-epimerase
MKLGVTTYLWSAEFTPATFDVLPRLRAAGFDGVEIPAFRPETFPAAAIRRALEANRLECTIALALVPGLSLIDDDPAVRRKTLTHVEAIIRVAAEVGASIIAGPVYCPVGYLPGRRRTTDEWQRAIDAYRALGPVLDAHGVTLALEPLNRFETYFLNTVADGVRLSDAVGHPRVGLLVDTFHANIEEKDVAAAYRAAGAHVRHVHTSENDRGTPGSGHVPWAGVFDALREIRYDGWLTIESFGFSLGDLSAAASIWRDIEASPDAIAMDGLRFLKQYRHGG